jgi:hypothetical protein
MAQLATKQIMLSSGTCAQPGSLGHVLVSDSNGNMTWGEPENNGTTIIMKDVETGVRYKLVIRNGELCIEGTDTQTTRETKINNLFK